MSRDREIAVFGMGCFWCTEAVFQEVEGVIDVVVGYAGGWMDNPTYRDVIYKDTGHAEVAKITFDPSVIDYETLVDIFWTVHDPTTLNKQGADVGPQYRSAIFYLNQEQKKKAEKSKENAQESIWNDKIVTEIAALDEGFYKAEVDHQEYYNKHPNAGYCKVVIDPKVKKMRNRFKKHLKEQD